MGTEHTPARERQIILWATAGYPESPETRLILIRGETALAELHEAVAEAIALQHPDLAGLPIRMLRYRVGENTDG